jgi:peptidyl-prolyl cis-trans isomerase D
MLRNIHRVSSTWLGKIVMAIVFGVITISFAIWGIGDIFSGFGTREVAKIGGAEISTEQFRQYYSDQLQQLGRQRGKVITSDQARAAGLDRQILGQLIAQTTLDEQAHNLRLGLSDAAIAEHIKGDPSFRGPTGKFDPNVFARIINEAGFTETRFVAEQRNVLLRRQIVQSITGDIRVPKVALEAFNQFRNEKRNVDYIALGPAQAGDVPAATADQLQKYFDARKELFRAPEYRKITILAVTPAELAKPADVSNADAKTYYEQHKAEYGRPEKRDVRQIVFQKPEDAAAAREKIAKGASFDDITKARGLKPSDTNLGMVTQAGVIDAAVGKVAFALKSGEVSQPIKGEFGTVLVTVGKIEPGETKSYEQVAPQIKQILAEQRARNKLGDLRDKIEDEKAAGATLAEAGKKLGLSTRVIDAVDRAGNAPDGKRVPNLPRTPDVVAAAFASDVGVDNEALTLPGGGYVYFDVNGITPSRERTLAEVKNKVETSWRNDETAKRLKAKADDMVAKLKSGSTLADVGKLAGVQVQKATDLTRASGAGFTPPRLVQAAFRTPKDVPDSTAGDKETERYVYRVTAVTEPKLDANAPDMKVLANSLQTAYSDDIIGEYIAQLESEFGVTINQTAFNQVVGGGGEPGS